MSAKIKGGEKRSKGGRWRAAQRERVKGTLRQSEGWRGAPLTLFVCAGSNLMVLLRVVSKELGGISWEIGARGEGEGAMLEHGGKEVMNERKGLGVEIGEHGVGAPAADQPDDALVAAAA